MHRSPLIASRLFEKCTRCIKKLEVCQLHTFLASLSRLNPICNDRPKKVWRTGILMEDAYCRIRAKVVMMDRSRIKIRKPSYCKTNHVFRFASTEPNTSGILNYFLAWMLLLGFAVKHSHMAKYRFQNPLATGNTFEFL